MLLFTRGRAALGGWGLWAGELVVVKGMTITFVPHPLRTTSSAPGGVWFASSLPNYKFLLEDQIKMKEKEIYRRALTI